MHHPFHLSRNGNEIRMNGLGMPIVVAGFAFCLVLSGVWLCVWMRRDRFYLNTAFSLVWTLSLSHVCFLSLLPLHTYPHTLAHGISLFDLESTLAFCLSRRLNDSAFFSTLYASISPPFWCLFCNAMQSWKRLPGNDQDEPRGSHRSVMFNDDCQSIW